MRNIQKVALLVVLIVALSRIGSSAQVLRTPSRPGSSSNGGDGADDVAATLVTESTRVDANSVITSTEIQGANPRLMIDNPTTDSPKESSTQPSSLAAISLPPDVGGSSNSTKDTLRANTTKTNAGVLPTTYRPSRPTSPSATGQERDSKLMNLLLARRNALPRDRFRTHRRVVTTGRSSSATSVEATSKSPPNSRSLCDRNCTKNFTRRTTASCMRQCAALQRATNSTNVQAAAPPSIRTKVDEKDNNEILLTDESSHGFVIVTKDNETTFNHITGTSTEKSARKLRIKSRPNIAVSAEDVEVFGQKRPPLKPSLLRISKVSDDHPKIFEVSEERPSAVPVERRDRNTVRSRFSTRDRMSVAFNRRNGNVGNGTKLTTTTTLAPPQSVVKLVSRSSLDRLIMEASKMNDTLNLWEVTTTTTTTERAIRSTPLIISVPEIETTMSPSTTTTTTTTTSTTTTTTTTPAPPPPPPPVEDLIPLHIPQHETDGDANLIIFMNRTEDLHPTMPPTPAAPSPRPTMSTTTIRPTPRNSQKPQPASVVPSTNSSLFGRPPNVSVSEAGITIHDILAEDPAASESRMNLASCVLGALGMLPVLVIVMYLIKNAIRRRRDKKGVPDLDIFVTDQQPISPVRKMDKYGYEPDDDGDDEEEDAVSRDDGYSMTSDLEIERKSLRFKCLLGEGNFGQVYKAEADDLSGHLGTTRIVAVKTVRPGSSQAGLKEEATIMRKLGSHPNVVTLLGACLDKKPHLLIMEFAMRGRLLSLLRAARSANNILPASVPGGRSLAPLSPRTMVGFALDIARGMEYISEKKIVHGDLAARNVLLDHNGVCKICDFGMSFDFGVLHKKRKRPPVPIENRFKFDFSERLMHHLHHGFSSNGKPKKPALPIRWMAPEALCHEVLTTQTDVWAFGIVLWEIATLGSTPYPNLSAREVVHNVINGIRPELPKDARTDFYDLMTSCWAHEALHRPIFSEIRMRISRSLCKWVDDDATSDYMDVSGFSEDLEHGMLYFNRRISEFECEI